MSFPVRQAKDRVNHRAIIILAVLGVVVAVFASAVPAWMLERRALLWLDAPTRASHAPVAPREINIVDQTLLEPERRGERSARERQLRTLERYGWLDRARGVVHIPIEQAMALIVEESAP